MKQDQPVPVADLQQRIKDAIQQQYGLGPSDFCHSEYPKKWGLTQAPGTLLIYLTSTKTVSYPALKILCEKLNLGTLDRKVQIVKTVHYSIHNSR